jgi:hypothetical protein
MMSERDSHRKVAVSFWRAIVHFVQRVRYALIAFADRRRGHANGMMRASLKAIEPISNNDHEYDQRKTS